MWKVPVIFLKCHVPSLKTQSETLNSGISFNYGTNHLVLDELVTS